MSFSLTLSSLSTQRRRQVLKDFTVQPEPTQYEPNPPRYHCFHADAETDTLTLPLGAWKKFLDPRDGFPNGEYEDFPPINPKAKFTRELLTIETDPTGRDRDQDVVVREALRRLETEGSVFIACFTGFGKCLAPGTEVLMFDGTKKVVEDIVVGELLMGDDSKPRTVLSTISGQEEMYEIVPTKGEPFTVNKSHILSLKASGQGRIQYIPSRSNSYTVHWFDGRKCTSKSFPSLEEAEVHSDHVSKTNVFDIEVRDYIDLNNQAKHILKSYWVPVDYTEQKVPLDPRFLGMWLGDGTSARTMITTIDGEIMDYVEEFAEANNLRFYLSIYPDVVQCVVAGKSGSGSSHTNSALAALQEMKLINNKHIPLIYKANSRKIRLEILAGLIDTDGYYSRGCYEITQKRRVLAYDIQDICRSLGFACFVYPTKKSCMYKGEKREGLYYRVSFSGEGLDEIPVLLKRKRGEVRNQVKDALVTGFKLVPKGVGTYYGFEIDGNRRFLLGSHMVTHNTATGIYLSLTLGLKTMIICHFDIVRQQWPGEYQKFSGGNVKTQFLKGKGCQLDPDADVYIVGIQKAANMSADDFITIGTVIIDESHIATVTAFTKTLLKFQPRYLIGLSATPDRRDGLHSLLTNYFGDTSEFIVRKETKNFTVYKLQTPFKPEISYTVVRGRTVPNWCAIVSSIEENEQRHKLIADIACEHPDEKIIILCNRNVQSIGVYDILRERGESVDLLIGTTKKYDKTKRILVAGFKKGGVGLNDPDLTMAIIASDTKDVRQYEGRIRTTDNIIYHLVDYYKSFQNHWEECEEWYSSKGAEIKTLGTKHVFKSNKASAAKTGATRRFLSKK